MSATDVQPRFPRYFGTKPVEYRGVFFGLEKYTDIALEFNEIATQEWEEVGDEARLGPLGINIEQLIKQEYAARLLLFTVRDTATLELVGYLLMIISTGLKQPVLTAAEQAIYLKESARSGFTAKKLVQYAEDFLSRHGVKRMILSHRIGDERIGKLFTRTGYTPLTVSYMKDISNGEL